MAFTKAGEAAIALNAAFAKVIPSSQKKRLSEAEWVSALHRFHQNAATIPQQYKLGVFGRALTVYRFQKILVASGFPPDIVRKVAFSLLLNGFAAKR